MNSSAPVVAPAYSDSRPAFLPLRSFGAFVIALLAVVVLAYFSYQSLRERSRTSAEVAQSNAVVDSLRQVLSSAKDLETGIRGFLATGNESFMQPFLEADARIDAELQRVRSQLDAASGPQHEAMEELQRLIDGLRQQLAAGAEQRRQAEPSEPAMEAEMQRGKLAMDGIRATIQRMVDAETASLATARAQWERAASLSFVLQLGGAGVLLLLIAIGALLASRDYRERENHGWLRTGQVTLATRLQGDMRLETLGETVLQFLVHFLAARQGAVYAVEGERLQRIAAHAAPASPAVVESGAGLLGQAMKSLGTVHVVPVPADYFPIESALGRAVPRQLVILAARVDTSLVAMVELGFFRTLEERDLQFLERAGEMLATAVRSSRDRSHLEVLLEETQRQSEELQSQQEELRVSNEELEEQGRLLRHSQAMLESQQAEMEQTNLQLEEQTRQLEIQRDDLAQAQAVLESRAEELQRANQYKTEFLANMSHELRTPLNSTLILAKLLADNAQGNLSDEQVRYARTIGSAGNDLLALINDILDLSKIEAGKVELQTESIDLPSLLDALAGGFEPMARDKGLGFSVAIEAGTPQLLISDRQRLMQVLKNLLSNAIKFTERGEVSVQVRAEGADQLAIAVRDTGIGLPRSQHEVIFEAFRQADGSTHRKYGGTGLGLSISRDLARMLGGDIAVSSVPGEGSVFTLTIPVRAPEAGSANATAANTTTRTETPASAAAAAVAAASAATATLPSSRQAMAAPLVDDDRHQLANRRVILVIEDDAAFAAILRDLARELGFQCVVAGNAQDGLFAASKYAPDAILLDMKLPDQSGLGVLDRLKRDSRTRHIPVHVVSMSDYAREALELGAIGYALKPVKRDELMRAMQRLESKFSQQLRRVLVVEDDARQRESMIALLATPETEITGASSAGEALALLDGTAFDCIVMDLNLPDLSGYELLERMAQREDPALPPVIVYTGRSLSREEELKLRRFSKSIIVKGARSPERLLDEVTLFLHQVESRLPADRQRMLQQVRDRDAQLEGRRVLVVEDDVRNIFALSSVLEPKGAKLEIARNGLEALRALERSSASGGAPIDLVLMDIMMPEMDGLTAMREIRKRPEWARVPIIALTAKAMKDDHEQCLAAGANDYIAKPLDVDRLLSLIRVWMPK